MLWRGSRHDQYGVCGITLRYGAGTVQRRGARVMAQRPWVPPVEESGPIRWMRGVRCDRGFVRRCSVRGRPMFDDHAISRNNPCSGFLRQEFQASARPAAGWSEDGRGVWPEGLAAPIGELVRMTTPAGVFFDLDDTIVAFEAVADDSWNRAIAKNAGRLGALAPETVFQALRASAREYWSDPDRHRRGRLDLNGARRQIVFAGLSALGVSDPLLVECLSADYDSIRNAAVHVFPGALAVLQAFRSEGRALALITNGTKASQWAKIDRFDLGRLFDLILVEEEFGVGKPDPAVYRHALQTLALDPASTVMVGDNWAWDIVGAARVGIAPVWVNREKRPRPAGDPVPGVREVRSVAELPALLGRADL